jgi:hypothetical protein
MTGRVVAFGLLVVDPSDGVVSVAIEDTTKHDEDQLLSLFWQAADVNRAQGFTMVGHNIFGFDLPFLARRSWRLEVPVPKWVFDPRYSRFSETFVDTAKMFGLGSLREAFVSLDSVTEFLRVGRKNGSGADFHRLLQSDRQAAHDYLRLDLQLTYNAAKAMGIC